MNIFKTCLIIPAVAAMFSSVAFGQGKSSNVLDLKYSIEDNYIVYPESYETNSQKLLERWYLKNYTSTDLAPTSDYDPGATDEQLRQRLAELPTVIDLPYNSIVKSYIERFTKKGRKQVTALLGLSSYYMPIFEQGLEEAGLPLELKYLPIVESGLDPCATSKHGAAGLWQFIIASAKGYDMEVNSLVDERRDPYISTAKACKMLKDLYETYGDWSLAIAAYNCGPGTVNKALQRAGGTPETHDFWSIYYYLPSETRGYVPMFIAVNYVMNYYPEHNISPVLPTKPLVTDSVHLTERVHFNQIAAVLDIPVEELRVLNPQYRADIIPASATHPYHLILPSQQMHAFIVSQDQILAYEKDKYARKMDASPGSDPGVMEEEVAEELMAQGEPLNPADQAPVEATAAQETYEEIHPETVTSRRHRKNDSQSQSESSSQQPPAEPAPAESAGVQESPTESPAPEPAPAATTTKKSDTKKKSTTSSKPKTTTHTVAEGENLSVIAKKYGVSVDDIKNSNSKLKNTDMIHPGDKLTIPEKKKK